MGFLALASIFVTQPHGSRCYLTYFPPQAILFYIPRYLWKVFEGGKIKMLVAQLNTPIVDEEVKKSRVEMMVKYFSINLNTHNQYAIKFIICEALNFVNVVGQIYFTDRCV